VGCGDHDTGIGADLPGQVGDGRCRQDPAPQDGGTVEQIAAVSAASSSGPIAAYPVPSESDRLMSEDVGGRAAEPKREFRCEVDVGNAADTIRSKQPPIPIHPSARQ